MSLTQKEGSSLQTTAGVPRYHAPFLIAYSKLRSIAEKSFEEVELLLIREMAMRMENGRVDLLLICHYDYFKAVIEPSENSIWPFLVTSLEWEWKCSQN